MNEHIQGLIDSLTTKPTSVFIDAHKAELTFKNKNGDWLNVCIADASSYRLMYEYESADGWRKEIDYINLLDLDERVEEFMGEERRK